jgi:Zn-dependent protease
LFLLGKGKLLLLGLTQAKTFFSMALAVGVYTTVFGWWFALGFVVAIYIHEMGHVAALRRYGISATAPMFIPGVGAFVRMNQRPATPGEDARVGLAGPIWGAAASLAALVAGKLLEVPILLAIGHVSAWINLLNLLPVWQLDGSRAFAALSRRYRAIAAGVLWVIAFFGIDVTIFILAIAATVRAWMQSPETPAVGDRPVLATYIGLAIGLALMMKMGGALDAIGAR